IDRVRDEAWPQPERADELHDALVELGFIRASEGGGWEAYLAELQEARRAAVLETANLVADSNSDNTLRWVAAERLPLLQAIFPGARLTPTTSAPEAYAGIAWSFEDALVEILRGRLEGLGPVTVGKLAEDCGLAQFNIEAALLRLEAEGFVIRGKFTPGTSETEWCARRLLARIHSYTLNRF